MKAVFEKKNHFNIVSKRVTNFLGFPPMFHPHCELIYLLSGKIDMVIDGCEHTLTEGEISIAFPFVTHCYENSPEAEAIILLFDSTVTGALETSILTKKPVFPFTEKLKYLLPIFNRINELTRTADTVQNQTASSYLTAIIGEILSAVPLCKTNNESPDISQKILAYCSEHFTDDDISIKKVSDALYISSSYVSKVFAKTLKCKFREYINLLKVNHAKKLITKKEMKIVDVMLECGFKNQSSFNRIFVEICGTSPSEYRKQDSSK